MKRESTGIAAAALALALIAAACGTGSDDARDDSANRENSVPTVAEGTPEPADGEPADGEPPADLVDVDAMSDEELAEFLIGLSDAEFEEFTADLDDAEYDELLTFLESYEGGAEPQEPAPSGDTTTSTGGARDDVDCSPDGLGADDTVSFTTAHYVVNGALGNVCLGEADDRVNQAWDLLATITPTGQLADLGVFTGFESTEDGDEITLAFVNTLDSDGSLFQMSVNLETYAEDPNEAQLTMAHEFSHVFTSLPSQLDRTVEAGENCETYDNGEGCYLDDSIIFQWIRTFWGDGLIEQVDPLAEATAADGQARCDTSPGFFGAYAASSPEEDFAESFSVYVFDVETLNDEQQERIDWIAAQPGLAEFRDRAEAAGLTGLANNFDECGVG
jgi:hypothetical protein